LTLAKSQEGIKKEKWEWKHRIDEKSNQGNLVFLGTEPKFTNKYCTE
jgi:hypothetical protein